MATFKCPVCGYVVSFGECPCSDCIPGDVFCPVCVCSGTRMVKMAPAVLNVSTGLYEVSPA